MCDWCPFGDAISSEFASAVISDWVLEVYHIDRREKREKPKESSLENEFRIVSSR
jgi:hypothetical protein